MSLEHLQEDAGKAPASLVTFSMKDLHFHGE
ncbi:hypothetical protein ABMB67_002928 [Halalkalibacter oceani]